LGYTFNRREILDQQLATIRQEENENENKNPKGMCKVANVGKPRSDLDKFYDRRGGYVGDEFGVAVNQI